MLTTFWLVLYYSHAVLQKQSLLVFFKTDTSIIQSVSVTCIQHLMNMIQEKFDHKLNTWEKSVKGKEKKVYTISYSCNLF